MRMRFLTIGLGQQCSTGVYGKAQCLFWEEGCFPFISLASVCCPIFVVDPLFVFVGTFYVGRFDVSLTKCTSKMYCKISNSP